MKDALKPKILFLGLLSWLVPFAAAATPEFTIFSRSGGRDRPNV